MAEAKRAAEIRSLRVLEIAAVESRFLVLKHQQALKPNGSSETLASTIRTGSKTLCPPTDVSQLD